MASIAFKSNVRLKILTESLIFILNRLSWAHDKFSKDCPKTLTITSINDSQHMGNSRHYTNEAIDLRSKDFISNVAKSRFRENLENFLNENNPDKFTVLLESLGKDNEHFHIQVKKGQKFPQIFKMTITETTEVLTIVGSGIAFLIIVGKWIQRRESLAHQVAAQIRLVEDKIKGCEVSLDEIYDWKNKELPIMLDKEYARRTEVDLRLQYIEHKMEETSKTANEIKSDLQSLVIHLIGKGEYDRRKVSA